MTRSHKKQHHKDATVDMTPMLDIVFILLLFFIVTTSFMTTDSIGITQATNSCQKDCDTNSKPLVVTIDDQNQVSFNNRIIDIEAIQANIESQLVKNIKTPVVVKIHTEAYNSSMVSAVDQANKAGVSSVSVAKWQ